MSIAQAIVERDEGLAELARVREGVTVCVPCFEQSAYLDRCLSSIAQQTVKAVETIVVDDGSERTEAERIAAICASYPGTRLVRVVNRGLVGARNTGIMLARTVAWLPLDSDDWIAPEFIERTLPLLENADVVLTGIREHGEREGVYKPGFNKHWNLVSSRDMRSTNLFYYASLFRLDLLRSVGGYNAHMTPAGWEDWDLWHDLLDRRVRFAAVDEPLLNYHCRPGSMAKRAETQRQRNLAEMARHHRWI